MVRKTYAPEQIINKLREAEVLLSQGATIGEASRKIGVTEQTYYRWRKEYGGMRLEQAKRLKELEKENSRLKKLVTDMGELYAYSDGKLTRLQSRESIHLWAMAVRSDGSFYGVRRARGAPIHYYDANGNRIGTVVASTDCVFQMTLDRASSKLYYSESYTGDIVEKDLISGESRVLASGTGIPWYI